MIALRGALLAILATLLIASCSRDAQRKSLTISGISMGTGYQVEIVDPLPDLSLSELRLAIRDELAHIDAIASTYRDSSELARFNFSQSTSGFEVSAELCAMLDSAAAASHDTDGAFDMTVGSLVNVWGFGPGESTVSVPGADDIRAARSSSGSSKLEIDCDRNSIRKTAPALKVDLSGWAKGYAVDQLAALLDAAGQHNYLVELGGEIKAKGMSASAQAFAVALEHPIPGSAKAMVVVRLRNTGIATSGNYRNFFEVDDIRYSHTIDPRSGYPTHHDLLAVSVIHPSTAYADAIATALLVLGPHEGPALADQLDIAAYFAIAAASDVHYVASKAFTAGDFLREQTTE